MKMKKLILIIGVVVLFTACENEVVEQISKEQIEDLMNYQKLDDKSINIQINTTEINGYNIKR